MFLRSRFLLLTTTAVAAATPAFAQRDLKEIPPVDVDAEFASFKLAPGLEVNLFAQEPLIAKPIQMAWDEKGRLWVASSAIYPHIKPGQEQTDKILVLEDTDGDGKADKSTVFYEGLLIPTGILPGDGGAYVANSTELLFMKDTDGDGRADETKVLLSGFGTEDTHHILHSIKRGPEGYIYFNQSVYIHSHVETPYGVRRLSGSGIWQYRPESGRLEIFGMGQVNPWGHVFNKWGQSFTTDGAYVEGINYMFPGATFMCLPNQLPRVLKGLNPGQPKQCGLAVVSGSHFPGEWQGRLITCDFRGHRVNQFVVSDEGSGFSSRQLEDVMTSTHGAFRPVDVQMGPDGALYIADWYNPIIQHGEVDFRDERRDREHGRIWRVTVKDRPLSKLPAYAKLSAAELLELLDDSEQWVRTEAKEELKRRHQKGDAEIAAFLRKPLELSPSPSEDEKLAILEKTRLKQNLAPSWDNLRPLLASDDANLRAAGVRLAGTMAVHENTPKEVLDEMISGEHAKRFIADPSPRVRLETVNALRYFGTARAVELAANVLDHPMDENLDFALWLTCRQLADVWLPEFTAGRLTFGGNLDHISFALKAAERPEAAGALLTLIQDGRIPAEKAGEAIGLIGSLGTAAELSALLEFTENYKGRANVETAVFEALTAAARQRKVVAERGVEIILRALTPERATPAALRLAGAYKLEQARPELEALAKRADETGNAARLALAGLGGDASREFLMTLAARSAESAVKAGAVAALVALDAKAAAPTAAAFLFSGPGAEEAGLVFDAVVRQKEGPGALAEALKLLKLQPEVASVGVRKASGGGETAALAEALTVAGGLEPVTQLTPEQLEAMIAEVRTNGDAARGERVYRRPELQCVVCHAIGAVGGHIGPDLVSIGSSAPVDYLIESLLEPSKKIKEGYHSMIVTTKDGGLYSGFLQREDEHRLFLKDAAGQVVVVPKSDIAERQDNPVSLMPPGLTASLRRDEMIDLVRFLSELGKEGAYKQQADGYIRTWRALHPSDGLTQIVNKEGLRGLTGDNPEILWLPAYSLVNGELPLEDVPLVKAWQTPQRTVQGTIEVTTPGEVLLRLADPSAARIWVEDVEYPAAPEIRLNLPAGKHRVTLVLDPAERKSPVRVEVAPAPGSSARAVPVGGV